MIVNPANLQLSPEELRLVSDPGWILTKNSIVAKAVGMMGELAGVYREVWAGAAVGGGVAVAGVAVAGGGVAVAGDIAEGGVGTGAGGAGGAGAGGAGGGGTGGAGGGGAGGVGGAGGAGVRLHGLAGIEPGDPKVSRGENYRGLPWVMLDYPRIFGRENVLAIRTMFWWGQGWNITLVLKGTYHDLYLSVIRERRVVLDAAGFQVQVHPDEWRHEHTAEVYRSFSEVGEALGEGAFLKLSAAVRLDRWAEAPELLAGLFGTLVEVLRG